MHTTRAMKYRDEKRIPGIIFVPREGTRIEFGMLSSWKVVSNETIFFFFCNDVDYTILQCQIIMLSHQCQITEK